MKSNVIKLIWGLVVLAITFAGCYLEIKFAYNILLGLTWICATIVAFCFFCAIFLFIMDPEAFEAAIRRKKSVKEPKFLYVFSIVKMAILAGTGHWVLFGVDAFYTLFHFLVILIHSSYRYEKP